MLIGFLLSVYIINVAAEVVSNGSAFDQTDQNFSRQFWHSYRFNTGVGNREELYFANVELDKNFTSVDGVFMWKSLQLQEETFVIGLGSNFLLVTVYNENNDSYTYITELPGSPSSLCVFQKWSVNKQKVVGFVVVSISLSEINYILKWYQISNKSLNFLWDWPVQRNIDYIDVINVDNDLKLLLVSHLNGTIKNPSADIYSFNVNSYLDIWLFEKIVLNDVPSSITVFSDNQNTFFCASFPDIEKVYIFKYSKLLCLESPAKQKHFVPHQIIQSSGVKSIISFRAGLQWFLAVASKYSSIYVVKDDMLFYPVPNLNLKSYNHWAALPIDTYRGDVLLLLDSESDVSILTWKGDEKIQIVGSFIKLACKNDIDCLEKMHKVSLKKLVAFPFHNHQNIIISTEKGKPLVFKILVQLKPLPGKVTKKFTEILKTKNALQKHFSKQKNQIEELNAFIEKNSDKVEESSSEDVSSEIVTLSRKQFEKIETLSHTTNQTEILNSINNLILTINNLHHDFEKWSNYLKAKLSDQGQIPGEFIPGNVTHGITFYGDVLISDLNLFTLNGVNIDELFRDSFRKNKNEKIGGTKILTNLNVENVSVKQIDHILVCDIIFSDDLIEGGNKNLITGDIIWENDLNIINNFQLNPKFDLNVTSTQNYFEKLHLEELEVTDETYIQESINSQPFILPVHSGHLNIHYLDIVNQATVEQVNVKKDLNIDFINGKNFSDFLQQLLLKKYSRSDLNFAKIDGVLFTRDLQAVWLNNFELEKDIITKESEKSSLNTSNNSEISNQARSQNLKRRIIHVYQNISINGYLFTEKLNNIDWAVFNDTIRKNEKEFTVKSLKYFQQPLTTEKINLSGTINGKFVENVLKNITNQVIRSPQVFDKVHFKNLSIDGLWDEICVDCLNQSAVQLSFYKTCNLTFGDDCWLFSNRLNVTNYINNVDIKRKDLQSFKNESENKLDVKSIKASKITLHGSLISNGKVNNVNLTDFIARRVSLNSPQILDREIFLENLNVTENLQISTLNGNKILPIINAEGDTNLIENFLSGKIKKIKKLLVNGNVTAVQEVNGFNLEKIFERGIPVKKANIIKGNVTFENVIHFDNINVTDSIDNISLKKLEKDVIFKRGHVFLTGAKNFSTIKITKDMKARTLNGHLVQDIVTLEGDESIKGSVIINGNVIIKGNMTAYGTINNVFVSDLLKRFSSQEKAFVFDGDLKFNNLVTVENLVVGGNIQNKSFESMVEDAVLKKNCCNIPGTKTFTGEVKLKENVLVEGKVNDINFSHFLKEVVFINKPHQLKGIVTIKEAVFKELEIEDYFNSTFVNNFDINEWIEDSIPLDKREIINEKKVFEEVQVLQNIETNFINGHSPSATITLKSKQFIPIVALFPKIISTSDISIGGFVNNKNLKEEYEDSLLVSGNQKIKSRTLFNNQFDVFGDLKIDSIKGKKVSDLITLNTEQNISTPLEFQGSVTVSNGVADLNSINDIDLHKWNEKSVSLNREQIINGLWIVKGKIKVKNINGNGLLNTLNLTEFSKDVRGDRKMALEIKNETETELNDQCHNIKEISQKYAKLPYLFNKFEVAHEIETPFIIESVITFKINNDDYLIITMNNECFSFLYKWDKINTTFVNVKQINIGPVAKWSVVYFKNATYLITSSHKIYNCEKDLQEGNIWVFKGNSDKYSHLITTNAFIDITHENNYSDNFFTLDDKSNLYQWNIEDGGNVTSVLRLNVGKGIHKFIDFKVTGELAVTNGKEIKLITIKEENIIQHSFSFLSSNIVALPLDKKTLIASVVKDKIVIYENITEEKIFSVIHAYKIGSVLWFNFGLERQAFLIISSHHKLIDMYEFKSVSGLVRKMSIQLFSSKLQSVDLPTEKKYHLYKYIIVIQRKKLLFLQANMLGDYFQNVDLFC